MRVLRIVLLLLFFFANAVGGEIIEKVEIIGNEVVPKETILYYISQKPGKEFSRKAVAEDIKRLFKLGYFENLSVDAKKGKKGIVFRYFVKEKPIIVDFVFRGNDSISSKKLKEELGLVEETEEGEEKKVQKPLDYKFLDELVQKIEEIYAKKGFTQAEVTYSIDRISPTRAVVTFIIDEGKKANVCKIEIRGNKKVSDGDIKDVLLTKEKSILHLRFVSPLSKEKLKEDVERIKHLYYTKGFLDVEVEEPKVEKISKDCYKVIYTIKEEGSPYKFSKVMFEGNKLFSDKELRKLARKLKKGRRFNQEIVEKVAQKIADKYSEIGILFTDVEPEIKIHHETHTADVVFHISEGEKAYVGKITITGNVATRDRTIRRELDLYETGVFNTVRLKRSIRRLFNTGYFESVDVKPKIKGKKVDITVDVKERLTGMFSVGAGYSSVSKLVAMVGVSKGNLFGTGDSGSVSLQAGSRLFYFDIGYSHRWWLGKPQTLSLGVYNRRMEYFSFTSKKIGFSSMVTRRIWEDWKVGVGYMIERDKISDVKETASDLIKDQEGTTTVAMTTFFVSKDLRDNRFLPHRGKFYRLTTQVASGMLGGDEDFYKLIGEYAHYFNLSELPVDFELPFIASVRARVGYAESFGSTSEVPIDYRFYVGGDTTVRGFQWGEAGPKDKNGDPEGANRELIFNFELGYDVTKFLRLLTFLDVGGGWWDTYKIGDMRKGAGVGIRVLTPIGPIRLDIGWKLDRKTGESSSEWHFGLGSYF